MSGISPLDTAYWELKKNGKLPFETLVYLIRPMSEFIQRKKYYNHKEPYDFSRYESLLLKYIIKEYEKMGIENYAKGDSDIDVYNMLKKEMFKRNMPLLLIGGLGLVGIFVFSKMAKI